MGHDNSNVMRFGRQNSCRHVLERLFNEHGVALRRFLLARLGTSADLDDIAQDVFERLARIDDLEQRIPPGGPGGRTFIYTTANNLIVDMERRKAVRHRHQQAERQGVEEHSFSAAPDAMVEGIRTADALEKAILKLPKKWRQAFVMHRFNQMSYKQIAGKMNLSVRTVEKYVSVALARVRTAVEKSQGRSL